MKTYIIIFAAIYEDFRIPELETLNELLDLRLHLNKRCDLTSPYLLVQLPSDKEAKLLGSRSILIRHILERWADAPNYQQLHEINKATKSLWEHYIASASFKISIGSHRSTISETRKRRLVEDLSYMDFQGPIVMDSPDVEIVLHEEHVIEPTVIHRSGVVNDCLKWVWLGRKVCDGQRRLIDFFDLKKRVFIGNTSMESALSLIMANQANVGPDSLVLDPFCGTGSMLYPAAYFGALVTGSDIDGRQMRGKDLGVVGVKASAQQYGVVNNVLDLLTYDLTQHPWRIGGIFDAIICDPPYGVRAGAKRLGRSDSSKLKHEPYKMSDGKYSHEMDDYIPPRQPWEMSQVLEGLLSFAVLMLRNHGRLVYWLPTSKTNYKDSDVPSRPQLRLVSNSCQDFGRWQRRLITMEKVEDVDNNAHATINACQEAKEPTKQQNLIKEEDVPSSTLGHTQFREQYFNKFQSI